MKKVAIFLEEKFEELEAVAVIDILRRADTQVDLISVSNEEMVTGSHDITLKTDKKFASFALLGYDGIIIPGGPGVNLLLENHKLVEHIKEAYANKILIGAICAAPQLLGKAGIVDEKNITHYPGCGMFLDRAFSDITRSHVSDANIVTGSSPGGAVGFALALVEFLHGSSVKEKIAQQLVILPV